MNVVFTAHDAPYQEMADITRPSLQAYCEKHKYEFVYRPNIDPIEKDRCKARIFLELYNSGMYSERDVALWVDTDALIMNGDRNLDTLMSATVYGTPHDFLWSYDWNGPNSGVWAARFTSKAAHFISTYDWKANAMGWGDNEAMNQLSLLPPFSRYVACVPGKVMNCNLYELHGLQHMAHKNEINNYEPGDFILHLAGVEHNARMHYLREFAKVAT